ncbi:hypothetical protein B9R42_27535 [Arthrospira platensis PCC 7345]
MNPKIGGGYCRYSQLYVILEGSVMIEREVTFPNSNSKPYLRLSPHTAPDVDTLLSVGTGLQPPVL